MSRELTRVNTYKPTLAERKLLEVLINPEHLGKNVTEICEEAGISRGKYYQAIKIPGFNDLVTATTMDILKNKVSDILNATYLSAISGRGHQDRKMLLTMLGLYTDKQEIEHSGEMTQTVKNEIDLSNLSVEELKELEGIISKTTTNDKSD